MDTTKKMAAENTGELATSQLAHSHFFRFRLDEKQTQTLVSCTSCGTVLQALETSDEFKDIMSREEGELLIELKNKGYIVPDFPCKLIGKNVLLNISVEKTSGEASKETQIPKPEYKSEKPSMYESDKFITFYMNAQGGKNMKKKQFLKNSKLKSKGPLCIFAINGETLQDALQRDGRFSNFVFENKCYFRDVNAEANLELEFSLKVNSLKGRKFEICLKNEKIRWGKRKRGELSSDLKTPGVGSPQPSTSIKTEGKTNSKSPETCKEGTARELSLSKRQKCFTPDHDETLEILRNQFGELVEQMKKRYNKRTDSTLLSHIRGEFGKKPNDFSECDKVEELLKFGNSVCKINVNANVNVSVSQSTGFLLFDSYILTNAHLFKRDDNTWITDGQTLHSEFEVTATFQNENTGTDRVVRPIKPAFVDIQYGKNDCQQILDFAILELEDHNLLGKGLLCQYSPQPNSGGVCIIGHPGGKVKTMDFTKVIGHEEREETLKTKMGEGFNTYYLMTDLHGVVSAKTNLVTYDTCLFHGASGSPVFNDLCQVIGMHTGGLPYAKDKSYIEYALPLRTILENFLINMTTGNKEEILSKFIKQAATCTFLCQLINSFIDYIIEKNSPCLFPALKLWKTVMESKECQPDVFTDLQSKINKHICKMLPSGTPCISEDTELPMDYVS